MKPIIAVVDRTDLVQWHPELMLMKNNVMLPLFKSFVDRCQNLA